MKVVGICGGIGAGKSTVAGLLAERGAVVVDVDALGRSVLTHDKIRRAVVSEFGDGVLDANGEIDRAALAREVFSCEGRLTDLEAISHPAIDREIARCMEALSEDPPDLVVLDMAVLVESDLGKLADGRGYTEVVVVEARAEVRLERLVARGMAVDDARSRMAAQATDADRRAVADHVVVNNADEAALAEQVDELLCLLVA
ncbi:MAG TPA: dephospho-CoA kinase [Acidimicrobiaceae bacterium]|nr:dephospho-CoA kinase [Acidimicrobiaceae bacterium]HAZ56628.1 dephospho-CoA kinase [Acidimicrobiaceae bacterium]